MSVEMGPHRGVKIKVIETHGTVGGYSYQIECEPFWMEVTPEHLRAIEARKHWFDSHFPHHTP